ncbi:ATP-binding protein [Streptomyces sp. NBC_01527]|uniref:ATP-binding protein n=1 Tax=Streptomyces sp. NBC_01527 TaxID=2903894 RepID=UPI003862F0A1
MCCVDHGRVRSPWVTDSPFAAWDRIFADPGLCAAIADRITFRRTLIQTCTESYRYQATEFERQAEPPQ